MKKTIFPFGKYILIYGALFLAVIGVSIYVFTRSDNTWIRYVVLALLIAISGYFFLSPVFIYQIKIIDSTISMKNDFGLFQEDRIQKATTVELKEVKEYKVILSEKNSNGEPYKDKTSKKKYIEFIMNDDSIKRLYVSQLSNSQLYMILKYIKDVAGLDITNA